jgi:hypothetical protein
VAYVKLVGTENRHEDWTTEVVLERDNEGNVTKSIKAGVPVEITAEERKKLEGLGLTLEDSSAQEAKEVAENTQVAGSDVGGAAPSFGSTASQQQSGDKKNDK